MLRTIEDKPGIRIGGANINDLRYADDIVLIAGREEDPPICAIRIGNKSLEQVHTFKYFGTWISADGKSKADVTARIMQATKIFGQKSTFFLTRACQ